MASAEGKIRLASNDARFDASLSTPPASVPSMLPERPLAPG